MTQLSSVLKKRRKELGLTLAQIADQMGVAEATVQRWESGNIKSVRYDKINKLASVLKVAPAELMGWTNPDNHVLDETISIAAGIQVLRSIDPSRLDLMVRDFMANNYYVAYSAPGIAILVDYNTPLSSDDIEAFIKGYRIEYAEGHSERIKGRSNNLIDFNIPNIMALPETEYKPRVGRIACGDPIIAEENIETYDEVLSSWHADFTLMCVGDSMAPKIEDGDIVAIRAQPIVENGEIAAVRIGDEATLKRVFLHPDYVELRPINPNYDSIIRSKSEMEDIRIEGRAVGLCRNL